jgi:hypothetical protein
MFKWKRLHEPRFLAQRLNRGPKLPPICVAEKSLGVPGDRGLDSKSGAIHIETAGKAW